MLRFCLRRLGISYADLFSSCAGFTEQTFVEHQPKVILNCDHCSCTRDSDYLTLSFNAGNSLKQSIEFVLSKK